MLDATNFWIPMPGEVVMSGGQYERKGDMETPDVPIALWNIQSWTCK